ncbi:hypothetical protein KR222_007986 [Zaprionus bogoriensis]|nr:hypothetical protein KR222_007986 [Zaprionus bogoriensis]
MLRQFFGSPGGKPFLLMLAIAEFLHISGNLWMPLKITTNEADLSSALYLFGALLILMKVVSVLQEPEEEDPVRAACSCAYNVVVFIISLYVALILWNAYNVWMSRIITNIVVNYISRLMLSATLLYFALQAWVPDSNDIYEY